MAWKSSKNGQNGGKSGSAEARGAHKSTRQDGTWKRRPGSILGAVQLLMKDLCKKEKSHS